MSNSNLISKVYFPRLIIPAGAVVTAMVDLLISFVLLIFMMAYFHYVPSWHIIFLPFFILLAFASALGPGLFFTALTVKYRDFRYITPFIVQIGALASPVGYSTAIVHDLPAHHKLPFHFDPTPIYCLNPMVSVIEGFRWCLFHEPMVLTPFNFCLSAGMTILFMFLGVWVFRRTERSFADVI